MSANRREVKARADAKRVASGICINCTNPARPDRVSCAECAVKAKQRDVNRASGAAAVPTGTATRLLTSDQIEDAIRRFKGGETLDAISTVLGIKSGTLYQTFRRRGVKPGRAQGKKSIVADPHCFAHPDTSEHAAYFIGLLMADGSVSDRGGVTINLQHTDRAILDELNTFLGDVYQVREVASPLGRYSNKPIARLSFYCRTVTADLASFGVVPRKTYGSRFTGGVEHNRHTWRGMIDGDGSICFHAESGYPSISLCGTKETVDQFEAFVLSISPSNGTTTRKTQSEHLFQLSVNGRHAKVLAGVLYGECNVALPRKLLLSRRAMQWEPQRIRTD